MLTLFPYPRTAKNVKVIVVTMTICFFSSNGGIELVTLVCRELVSQLSLAFYNSFTIVDLFVYQKNKIR